MHQPLSNQKVECAVDGWWRRDFAVFAEHRQNVIGSKWIMALPDQPQHFFPNRRQAYLVFLAHFASALQGAVHAMIVIMGCAGNRDCFFICHAMSYVESQNLIHYNIVLLAGAP